MLIEVQKSKLHEHLKLQPQYAEQLATKEAHRSTGVLRRNICTQNCVLTWSMKPNPSPCFEGLHKRTTQRHFIFCHLFNYCH